MFTLRKISGSGVEMNFSLGNSYTIIMKNNHPEKFKEAQDTGQVMVDDCIYGYVSGEGAKIHQLSDKQHAYIMTENGNTFDCLTKKG